MGLTPIGFGVLETFTQHCDARSLSHGADDDVHKATRSAGRRLAGWAWASPNTALGLGAGLVMLALGGRVQRVDGVIEFHGGLVGRGVRRLGRLGFGAMTLGHVIVGVGQAELMALRRHEQVHVAQYERWGPLFLPAYVASGVWQLVRGRCPYRDNCFERQAYAANGSDEPAATPEPPGDGRLLAHSPHAEP